MNKLTAEKCRELISHLKVLISIGDVSDSERSYLQALEIALPILEQQERGEGEWIEWKGGERPISGSVMVEVRFKRCAYLRKAKAKQLDWTHHGNISDLIAYRIIPERATNHNGGDA